MKNPFNPNVDRRTILKTTALTTAAAWAGVSFAQDDVTPSLTTETPEARGALGTRVPRADGTLKIQGQARYAIEQHLEGLLYGVAVQSTIPAGRVSNMDLAAASSSPGVIAIYTPNNSLGIRPATVFTKGGAATEAFVPLQDDSVSWNGQHIALVVAETFEQATHAASLVKVQYEQSPAIIDALMPQAKPQQIADFDVNWGNAQPAFDDAAVKIDQEYNTPREYNVPMEPHACIAQWQDGDLTVWESSQWVGGARNVISEWMGMDIDKVRVISPFVGGGFGSKVAPHAHVAMACGASRVLKRPVKVSLTRPQTFTGLGGRPRTSQRIALGATDQGRLVSIVHSGWNETAIDDAYFEPSNVVTALMYEVPNFSSHHSIIPVNSVTPGWMRAPGENISAYAIESAMDELAVELRIDPVDLRVRNWADRDPQAKIPWTTRRLREAYQAGAVAFGWADRNPEPRSMREGRELIGWGMAAGTYPVRRTPGEAKIVIHVDGRIEVLSGGTDLGTGTYTILAQTAAQVLDVRSDRVSVLLGDTNLTRAPLAGGSQLANLLTGAVHKTALAARSQMLVIATTDTRSPLHGADPSNLVVRDGYIRPRQRPGNGLSFGDLLKATGRDVLEVTADTFKASATEDDRNAADRTFSQMLLPTHGDVSAHSWGAHFVEVRVDEDFGTVRVKRMVGVFDCGRIYNPRLAESQLIGGMIMGIGQALLEEGHVDPRDGRIVNANLADYVVPVNADIPDIQVITVGVPDLQASALGGKAVGEVGIVGVAAAIGNAVYHATGKRVRDLPITLDKLVS